MPATLPPRVDAPRRSLRSDLRAGTGDGSAYSVMVGVGETYLPAFALAMNMGAVVSGLISTVPMLAGSVLQLISPAGVRWLGTHRRWAVFCAVVQAAAFLPLIVVALVGAHPGSSDDPNWRVWLLFGVASIYWASSLGCGPAWNTWMGALLPARIRASYFARRSRWTQLAVLVGFLSGGIVLQMATPRGWELPAFATLFCIASACRFASAYFLYSQSEPRVPPPKPKRVPLYTLLHGNGAGLLAFLLCMQVCVQISGPYFTPYMRNVLGFEYWQYAAIFGIQFGTRMLAMPTLGRFAKRWGADRLLWMMSFGVVPLSAAWIVSDNFYYLFTLQMISGVFWGGYELAYLLLFFETIPAEERTSRLTGFNLANSLAICVGSLVGATMLDWLGKTQEAYYALFALSGTMRAVTIIGIAWLPRIAVRVRPMALRAIGMRLGGAPLDEPVLPSIEDEERDSGLGTRG